MYGYFPTHARVVPGQPAQLILDEEDVLEESIDTLLGVDSLQLLSFVTTCEDPVVCLQDWWIVTSYKFIRSN